MQPINRDFIEGKTVVITGGNSGIGKATAIELAKLNANVVIVARDPKKGKVALQEIQLLSNNSSVTMLQGSLSSVDLVKDLSKTLLSTLPAIHVLINNAGIWSDKRILTADNLESTFAVNHLAPFLLTNLLLGRLKESAPSRIINVSSELHRAGSINFKDLQMQKNYSGLKAYSASKLCNILFTRELANRTSGMGITVNSLHPGAIRTNLFEDSHGVLGFLARITALFMNSPAKGADTSTF